MIGIFPDRGLRWRHFRGADATSGARQIYDPGHAAAWFMTADGEQPAAPPAQDTAALAAEIAALRREVRGLRGQVQAQSPGKHGNSGITRAGGGRTEEQRVSGAGGSLPLPTRSSVALEPSVHVALAGIALPNDASVALHRKHGFTEVGTFREYAIKNGQYISSVWMQRACRPAPSPGQQPAP